MKLKNWFTPVGHFGLIEKEKLWKETAVKKVFKFFCTIDMKQKKLVNTMLYHTIYYRANKIKHMYS